MDWFGCSSKISSGCLVWLFFPIKNESIGVKDLRSLNAFVLAKFVWHFINQGTMVFDFPTSLFWLKLDEGK